MLPTLLFNLIAGLKLVCFRPLASIGFRYTVTAFWAIALLNIVLVAAIQRSAIDEAVLFQAEGVFPEAFFIVLVLLSAALISWFIRSRLLQFRFPVAFLNAVFWVQGLTAVYQSWGVTGTLAWIVYWALQFWLVLVIFRSLRHAARADCEQVRLRRWIAAAGFALLIQLPPSYLYPFEFWIPARYTLAEASASTEAPPMLDAEAVLTGQTALLHRQLRSLAPSERGVVDAYFLGYAPWGDQRVFANEVRLAKNRFDERFGTTGRSLSLINDGERVETQALAIASNLSSSLEWLGKIAQPDEDILYLFITSHGGENYDIGTTLANLPLNDLPAARLATLLADSGFKWKVVIVSSCYSGGHIPLLANDSSMIITASRADRTSFGCTDDAEYTYFGRAFLAEALADERDFTEAFEHASDVIASREAAEGFMPSEPQMAVGDLIEAYLEKRAVAVRPAASENKKPRDQRTDHPGSRDDHP